MNPLSLPADLCDCCFSGGRAHYINQISVPDPSKGAEPTTKCPSPNGSRAETPSGNSYFLELYGLDLRVLKLSFQPFFLPKAVKHS